MQLPCQPFFLDPGGSAPSPEGRVPRRTYRREGSLCFFPAPHLGTGRNQPNLPDGEAKRRSRSRGHSLCGAMVLSCPSRFNFNSICVTNRRSTFLLGRPIANAKRGSDYLKISRPIHAKLPSTHNKISGHRVVRATAHGAGRARALSALPWPASSARKA